MSEPENRPSSLNPQFRLREAGIAFTAISVVLALSAPWFRTFNQQQWLALLRFALCVSVGAGGYYLLMGSQLQRTLEQAGKLLLTVNEKSAAVKKIAAQLFCAAIFAFTCFQELYKIRLLGSDLPAGMVTLTAIEYIFPLTMTYQMLFILELSKSKTRLHEHGVIMGRQFFPWKQIERVKWTSWKPEQLILSINAMQLPGIKVLPKQREQVEAILRDHLAEPSLAVDADA
ncbi:hypothetical protein [Blastopirellula marina]|uniref:DUF5673 domain-containing protein n=1 Tax=Blastopirellula marina TaxID=124 RepID=A0A2S8GFA5_9BACT|nr:hypothetical protein [Blastopirellula marina]PQO43148.1 hypothetical protein C5Y93_25930 [Blastopirellula marina]